ncbi:mobilization protein [Vibrio ichthyoenteri ATCC 700023]|uniref:Mobilization protein n=1 Tax=Vibrio ichthyoenteri ATCC 700023 TaxID=870968 RepID=F9S038_9VIBR|nr:mobilization protein [Vibrio ichthyoenteri ATCC 700023]
MKSSEQKIKDDINAQNRRMSVLVLKSWLWIVLSIILVLSACAGVIWWQGNMILANQLEIDQQNLTIEELKLKGGNIQLDKCGERICIAQAKDGKVWTRRIDSRPMFIPEGY